MGYVGVIGIFLLSCELYIALGEGGLYSLFIHKSLIVLSILFFSCFNGLAFGRISVNLFVLLALFILENDAKGIILELNDESSLTLW